VTAPSPGGGGALVLVVDDSDQNRKLARDVLRAAGFRTVEATSGGEAIALAAERLPDVILMDMRLPDMDGTDATQAIREDERTALIPIVALSSLPMDGNAGWLLAAGFAGYLEKPISVRDFPGQVRRYCAGAEA
jgi:two-component system cell cycle response regulator DivK